MRAARTAPLCGRCLEGFEDFGGLGFASPDTVLQDLHGGFLSPFRGGCKKLPL